MSDGGAQHIVFGPYFDSAGVIYPNIKVYHYDAGTTDDADMWSDENKATTVAQPFIGDTGGIVAIVVGLQDHPGAHRVRSFKDIVAARVSGHGDRHAIDLAVVTVS